jgi:hypothetical protein
LVSRTWAQPRAKAEGTVSLICWDDTVEADVFAGDVANDVAGIVDCRYQ